MQEAIRKCPSCHIDMTKREFKRTTTGTLYLDICFRCRCIWFDEFESTAIAPSGVIALFEEIHEREQEPSLPWSDILKCPRCDDALTKRFDVTKNGKFTYQSCHNGHGRLNSFSSFLSEKGFVRQLTGDEIKDLAEKVKTIRCTGCGGPVDIRTESVCSHCRSPIVVLDPDAVRNTLYGLKTRADREGIVDHEAMADAIIGNERIKEAEKLRQRIERSRSPFRFEAPEVESGHDIVVDLLGAGIAFIFRKLHD